MKVHLYDVVSCMVEIVMNLKLGSQLMVQVLIIPNLKCPVEELRDYWAIAPSTYNLKGYKIKPPCYYIDIIMYYDTLILALSTWKQPIPSERLHPLHLLRHLYMYIISPLKNLKMYSKS